MMEIPKCPSLPLDDSKNEVESGKGANLGVHKSVRR